MVLLADTDSTLLWAGAIGGTLTTVGGAILGLWFVFRSKSMEVERTEDRNNIASQRERSAAEHEDRAHDIESLRSIIEDLRGDVKEQRKNYTELQRSFTTRMNESTTAHHECEKKYAVLEDRLQRTLKDLADNQAYTESLESRIRVLESTSDGGSK